MYGRMKCFHSASEDLGCVGNVAYVAVGLAPMGNSNDT